MILSEGKGMMASEPSENSVNAPDLNLPLPGGGRKTPQALIALGDGAVRARWRDALRARGWEVQEAASGAEALALLERSTLVVSFCGDDLPDFSAVEIFRRLQRNAEWQPTLLVHVAAPQTAKMSPDAEEAGAEAWLPRDASEREVAAICRMARRITDLEEGLRLRNGQFEQISGRLNQELETIANIQKSLLPQEIPRMPGLEFDAFYWPSTECGGDYYDLVELDRNRLGFLIADVSGHGAPAMITMTLIRQNLHLMAPDYQAPEELLAEMNRRLWDHLPTNQFATMFYGILERETHRLTYSSAGHNPPLWFHGAERTVTPLEKCKGFPLKLVMREACYDRSTIDLQRGDRLVLYTDGIPECFNPEREVYGMERLTEVVEKEAAASIGALKTAIVNDTLGFANGHLPEDDLTIALLGVES